jgi:NAD(P) transhydrogenase
MSSRPTILPGRHVINSGLLTANVATMGAFVTMAPGAPMIAAGALAANATLSFIKGYTTTAAIGGADMREFSNSFCPTWEVADVLKRSSSRS